MKPGTLVLVATPIGNLGDITFRAVGTLKSVSVIGAEDTRRTKILCQRYGITAPLVRLDEHTERAKGPELVRRMREGESVALVTDAGMPGISDPGAYLVEQASGAGIPVTVIPGPSAATTALAVSGFRGDRFRFEGFPPRKAKALGQWLEGLRGETGPVICFESPYRLVKTLKAIQGVLGEIPVVVAREMTKLHEEVTRGSTSQALERYTQASAKGEVTILFWPKKKDERDE